jgi:hypothetical protein
MTVKQMARYALDVQSAVNLSGIIRSFAEITRAMRDEHGMDTPACNKHPVSRLFAEQIGHLTGMGIGDAQTYGEAYTRCVWLSKGDENE